MRQSLASIALIRRRGDGRTLWLAQWNTNWECYHFVGGHKRPGESFRQCMVRELEEELGVCDGVDCAVPAGPAAHLEYTAWSDGAGQETAYTMELFNVELTTEAARGQVEADPANRWLTEGEIREGRCRDGRPASHTMALLLDKAGLWEDGKEG
jgi:8-oxo-dGTP pyrophosphatase MutT (NUDIX family)